MSADLQPGAKAVPLSFVDMLGAHPETPLEPSRRPPSPSENPFFEVMQYDDGFFDNNGQRISFSAGKLPDHDRIERTEIQQQIDRLALLPDHSKLGQFSQELEDELEPESTVDGAFAAAMRRMGIDDESDEEGEDEFGFARTDEDEAWLPHGSRTMFMLDLLDNLPRLRLSDDHLKSIIWVMRECKTPNVPSFAALRKKQESLARDIGINSEHHTSSLGNHFYMNHPAKLFALSEKWTIETDPDDLSPMWANWKDKSQSHRHYYIKELAQLADGDYVVPLRWVTANNGICFNIKTGSLRRILASNLCFNYLDINAASSNIKFTNYSPNYPMPHPLREKAQGRPMFRMRIMPWSDDVSGNVSKQYNAHTNMYVTNLNLPHQKLQQEYFVRFASTSPYASSSEQFVALSQDCIPGVWHEAYDCELEQEILFEIIPHVLPADNPQQSETSSHIGMVGNYGCRRDLTGGTKEYRETDEGYGALYKPGEPRQTDVTIQIIQWQVWMACLGDKTALDASYTSTGVKDKISQYWITQLLEKAKVAHQEQLSNRDTRDPELNRSSCRGDERAALKTHIKYRIQKDLWDWVVQQPNEFIPLPENDRIDPHHDTPGELLHTYLLGNNNNRELGALLWYPEIKNMELYLADLEILINNLLDIWGVIDPNRILVKGKLHVLAHTIDDIRRFGPSVIYATEIQECWNAIFRLCSIFSNHLSPSRDIAKTLGDMERFKHMVSGGWWKNEDGKLGWSEKSRLQSGTVKLEASVKRHPSTWNLASPEPTPIGSNWSGDICKPGYWVFVSTRKLQHGFNIFRTQKPFAGRITKILARDGSILTRPGNAVVVLDPFIVLDVKDKRLNMPILVPATENSTTVTVNANIRSSFGKNASSRTLTELQTKHSDNPRFILNMHGLHNAHLIRDILPRSLTVPVPYLSDRIVSHRRFAAQLRQLGPAKRAETQAKSKATRDRNKKKDLSMASAQAQRQQDEHGGDSDMQGVQ
ncbi:hypothetical protein B0H14DRAFT_3126792 [Mycena olivaceomarginata]|nr:hypothetical protein B0H14DRAFT_3126792 [Mycena olivaceomarginata]